MTTATITPANTTADVARLWRLAGVSIIPLRLDGSKAPAIGSWLEYQSRLPTDDEVDGWFSRPAGIGVVCGAVSGGLEVIDFDAGDLFDPWRQLVSTIVERLAVVETGGAGFHVLYRCSEICGNQKIATNPAATKQTLIESRGQGGYIVGIGSPLKVHSSGNAYCQVSGPLLPDTITAITPAERKTLWAAARTFDRDGSIAKAKADFLKRQQAKPVSRQSGDLTPWDDHDRRANWIDLLQSAGWTSRDGENWSRPGKASGTSATLRQAESGCMVLVVFSSNAGINLRNGHQTLGATAFRCETQFGGNMAATARQLRSEGFGS